MNQPQFIPQQPAYNQNPGQKSVFDEKQNKSGKKMNIIIAVLGLLLVGLIVAIVVLLGGRGNDAEDDDKIKAEKTDELNDETDKVPEDETTAEAVTEAATEAETEAASEATTEAVTEATTEATTEAESDPNEYRERFGIDANTVEDYDANLDPDEYIYYDSGIGKFKFSYPAKLFNDVRFDDSSSTTVYGENIQTVDFWGSDGAEFIYSVYRRTDGKSISEFTDQINSYEHGSNYDVSDILVNADDEGGRIVLAGTMDAAGEKMIYDQLTIEDEYIYRMAVITRAYANEDERLKCSYITENVYRLSGFSGSTYKPRTYQEFVDSGQY